jgi:flagellar motor protein MotB
MVEIEGRKQSSESNAVPDSANANPQQVAQNPGGSNLDPNSKLNAQPKTEFAPLQPEEGGPNAIESASEDDQGDKKTEGEQKTATEKQPTQQNEQGTEPPPANEQTAQQLQQEKAQAAQTQKQTTGQQTQNNNQPDDENSQIETLQAEIAKLQAQRKKVIDKANEELRLKIRGEWFKLFATGVTVVMIFYYLAKIKIIKMIYSREPREAKNIQKEIEAKNKEIKKIKRTSLRNRLFSRSSSASA